MSQKKKKLLKKYEEVKQAADTVYLPSEGIIEILKKNWKILALIIVGSFIVYFNALNANFVSDDYASITQSPNLQNVKFMLGSFNTSSLTVFLNANIFGTSSPISYHAVNVIFLAIVTVIGYVVVYKLFDPIVAILTTLIFAVHPIHVEAVTWISGRPYLIIAMYVLLAFLFLIRYRETGHKFFLIWGTLAFIAGFFTDNPRPFSLFLILFLYFMMIGFKGFEKIWKYVPWMLVIVGIILVIAWPHIQARISAVNGGYNSSDSIFYNPFFQYPTGLAKYFQLLLWPFDLTLYHTMYIFPVWLNWAILLSYFSLIVYFYFKDRRFFFALAFIFAAVFPSMTPVKVSWLVAERYMFLGSLGFCMFIALILQDIRNRYSWIMWPIMMIILIGFSVRIIFRNIDWQTNHNLWVNTCQVSPNSHNAWNNIGDDYDKLQQYDNAVKGFTQSTIVKPNYADAFHNRANIFFKMGRLDLARGSYETALSFSPTLYQTYLSLINIDLIEKKMDLALQHSQKSLALQPNDPTANYVLAIVYSQRGETDKARAVLEGIVRAYPNFKQAVDALAQLNGASPK